MFCFIAIFVPYGIFPPWNTRVPSFPWGSAPYVELSLKRTVSPNCIFDFHENYSDDVTMMMSPFFDPSRKYTLFTDF
jgi:hypothetical protein